MVRVQKILICALTAGFITPALCHSPANGQHHSRAGRGGHHFRSGAERQDQGGEFQAWTDQYPLPEHIPFPQAYHELRYNPTEQVLGIVTGEGTARAAASITALGHDPRFDLSHAYWVVAAIAGIDPNVASVGSAAWAHYVVDGDLAHEIDAREIPPDWTTGYTPLGRYLPYQQPVPPASSINGQNVYTLNGRLVDWAYRFTKDIQLPDDDGLRQFGRPIPRPPPSCRPSC